MMEDFSGLALPPLFGGRILEAELELGPGGGPGPERDRERERERERERDDAQMHRSKCQALSRSCRDIEQVNEKILGRLHQVQRLTRRLRKERRFLMKTLDAYGDDYRTAQLTIPLEDEGKAADASLAAEEDGSPPAFAPQSAAAPKKKRHRPPRDRERDAQMAAEQLVLTEGPFTGFPSPSSLSH